MVELNPKPDYALERVDSALAGHFKDDYPVKGAEGVGFHIFGICPSCSHHTSALCAIKYLDTDTMVINSSSGWMITACQCACSHVHNNTPDGKVGCGTAWLLAVKSVPRLELQPVPEGDAYRYWFPAENVARDVPDSLGALRDSAGKWQAAFSAIIAVLAITSVADRDHLKAMPLAYQIAIMATFVSAVICNIGMLWLSNVANLGFPRRAPLESKRALINADIQPLVEAEAAFHDIKRARYLTIGCLCLLLTAIVLFTFAPNAVSNSSSSHAETALAVTAVGSDPLNQPARLAAAYPVLAASVYPQCQPV